VSGRRIAARIARRAALGTLLAAVLGLACNGAPTAPGDASPGPGSRRVLFVGNSLTYVNALPEMVRALSRAAGADSAVRVGMVAYPDYSLEDHWARGDAARAIAAEHWDVVVLQQGPSALESSRTLLVDYARRFAATARAAGAAPALYMVWPTIDRQDDFPRSSDSYRIAADSVHGTLLPVGDAWRAAWRRDAALALYAPDGLHPSVYGSYLAALVITSRLTGRAPATLPSSFTLDSGTRVDIPADVAATLRQAAADVR